MRILIVDDEALFRKGLRDLLTAAGYEVADAADGRIGVAMASEESFDLILLDRIMPGFDGIEACRRIREARPDVTILMLTSMDSIDDKVKGLQAGADDYVTKPFDSRELLARIQALGRRTLNSPSSPEILEADGCRLDLGRLRAERDGEVKTLTPREAGILRWLFRHRERVVSRSELLERVWGASTKIQTRTVDMTVANLRQKIERDPSNPRIVVTVTGAGYAWGSEKIS